MTSNTQIILISVILFFTSWSYAWFEYPFEKCHPTCPTVSFNPSNPSLYQGLSIHGIGRAQYPMIVHVLYESNTTDYLYNNRTIATTKIYEFSVNTDSDYFLRIPASWTNSATMIGVNLYIKRCETIICYINKIHWDDTNYVEFTFPQFANLDSVTTIDFDNPP